MDNLFFDGFDDLLRVAINVPLIYIAIIAFVRISGKRSTSQLNNFDWIVTVAMGSLCASGIVLKDVTLAETFLGISLLLLLQYILTRPSFHNDALEAVVKAKPTLLVHKGQFLETAMRKERVTKAEVLSAMRSSGIYDVAETQWVILETDARMSVIHKQGTISTGRASALENVQGFPPNLD